MNVLLFNVNKFFLYHGIIIWGKGVHHILVTVGTTYSGTLLHNSIIYYIMYVHRFLKNKVCTRMVWIKYPILFATFQCHWHEMQHINILDDVLNKWFTIALSKAISHAPFKALLNAKDSIQFIQTRIPMGTRETEHLVVGKPWLRCCPLWMPSSSRLVKCI